MPAALPEYSNTVPIPHIRRLKISYNSSSGGIFAPSAHLHGHCAHLWHPLNICKHFLKKWKPSLYAKLNKENSATYLFYSLSLALQMYPKPNIGTIMKPQTIYLPYRDQNILSKCHLSESSNIFENVITWLNRIYSKNERVNQHFKKSFSVIHKLV